MTRYEDHMILRLIHSEMLEEVLTNGMYSKNSGHEIPGYINIGDAELIKQREEYVVKIDPPNGHLGDYIPFYFAGHSPMLLNIKTGYRCVRYQISLRTVLIGVLPMAMLNLLSHNFITILRIYRCWIGIQSISSSGVPLKTIGIG